MIMLLEHVNVPSRIAVAFVDADGRQTPKEGHFYAMGGKG